MADHDYLVLHSGFQWLTVITKKKLHGGFE